MAILDDIVHSVINAIGGDLVDTSIRRFAIRNILKDISQFYDPLPSQRSVLSALRAQGLGIGNEAFREMYNVFKGRKDKISKQLSRPKDSLIPIKDIPTSPNHYYGKYIYHFTGLYVDEDTGQQILRRVSFVTDERITPNEAMDRLFRKYVEDLDNLYPSGGYTFGIPLYLTFEGIEQSSKRGF